MTLSAYVRSSIRQMIDRGYTFLGYSAGCLGLSEVASIAGSSKTMHGWFILNDRNLISTVLNKDEKYVSREAAERYASQAVAFADLFSQNGTLGVGVTASIASDYEKRSDDEAWIVVKQQNTLAHVVVHLKFTKDVQTRDGQNNIILAAATWAMGEQLKLRLLSCEEFISADTMRVEVNTWTVS